jgi:hypothetical protein
MAVMPSRNDCKRRPNLLVFRNFRKMYFLPTEARCNEGNFRLLPAKLVMVFRNSHSVWLVRRYLFHISDKDCKDRRNEDRNGLCLGISLHNLSNISF